ncbi:Spy/CpxP family protein refolding chaperone [Methylobacterium sp. J-067]|uniref:Spy/CpxP family protein refolding chaperone n=1 Tax=Methylobacterium sp. J-067 TaxID=2836648 RepID=UPI001FB8936D|nr:Spy/CpxP family protein refolding chaperone [Methylobacterium sp. J-067]MCJ2025460.1 Spy/CpxP family protein refolding chaperone [Methylobacterium sp. J-067]
MSRRTTALLATGLVGFGLAGAAWAHDRHHGGMHGRWSALTPEDRAAFADARIAAIHAGLKLTPDQEKLWPPVEAAMHDMAKMRQQRRAAMENGPRFADDAPAALRAMADMASARADALRKLADATQPLYASLDQDQKRRALILSRPMGPMGGPGWRHHHHDRDDEHGPEGDGR